MIEIGRKYDFVMLEWGDDGPGPVEYFSRTVSAVDGSLVKFTTAAVQLDLGVEVQEMPATEMIVNTSSQYFVSATPSK